MGHIRLGTLPDTRLWNFVVGLVAEGADVASVATATSRAAIKGLDLAHADAGLCHTIYLLTQLVLAAREDNFPAALSRSGITNSREPGFLDIVTGFSEAIDKHLSGKYRRTDIGEMAKRAAVESITALVRERSESLFGTTTDEIKRAAYDLSTKNGFAKLTHEFFSRFTHRFLNYHLSRELSNHVGGNGRFADSEQCSEFVKELGQHCREASEIVRTFARDWYSKKNFEGGITPGKARFFTDYAVTKLKAELTVRGGRDG